jgi:hypothetical protein
MFSLSRARTLLVVLLLALSSSFAQATLYFLEIEGITGDCQDETSEE